MFSLKKFLKKSIPAVIASAVLFSTASAAVAPEVAAQPAADTSVVTAGVLSSTVKGAVGAARSSSSMTTAETNIQKAIEQEAQRKAAAEAAAKAAAAYTPNYARQVVFSNTAAPAAVKAQGRSLGKFRLSFYCPCSKCCGSYANGITASGRYAKEGRTIAVDPRVIPLGSHVYIEGFGDFIAEDVGGAIKSNRIDVFLNSHKRCYDLGIAYANVYIM